MSYPIEGGEGVAIAPYAWTGLFVIGLGDSGWHVVRAPMSPTQVTEEDARALLKSFHIVRLAYNTQRDPDLSKWRVEKEWTR